MNTNKHSVTAAAIIVALSIFIYILYSNEKTTNSTKSNIVNTTSNSSKSTPTITADLNYVNTTNTPINSISPTPTTKQLEKNISKTISYAVPEGQETITVNLKLNNGVVTSLNVSHSGSDRHSVRYQDNFDTNINSLVVGKSLSSINVSRVGGASLTTNAFMNALNSIESSI